MRRIVSLFAMLIVMSSSIPTYSDEKYDPQNTMLALNMAIVSIHKIVTTEDRIVLQNEYDNIINKLALGNIENDYDMTDLYSELMNFIIGKELRNYEAERFREIFKYREQKQIAEAFSKIEMKGYDLWSIVGNLVVSCVSTYLEYQNSDAKAKLIEDLNNDLWKLKKEDIEECNGLQVQLLNASWNLLRQYKLPDDYRLTQDSLNGFYKAVNESDPSKRLRMLRARNIERNFQMYPPYWYYRAKTAIELNDDEEAARCYDKFAEVWRPVLRNDPYRLEEAKYRVMKLAKNAEKKRDEIRKWLEVIQDYTSVGDWRNNIFAGVAYFILGDKDEGIACVEVNVDFEYEESVSKKILDDMKNGELKTLKLVSFTGEIKDKQVGEALIDLFEGRKEEAEKALESMRGTSENPVVYDILHDIYELRGSDKVWNLVWVPYKENKEAYVDVMPLLEFYAERGAPSAQLLLGKLYSRGWIVKEDHEEAVKWFRKSAEQGYAPAQRWLGNAYSRGEGVSKNYKMAYMWFYLSYLGGDFYADRRLESLEGRTWFGLISPKLSKSEVEEAKAEAQRKYEEIKKCNGLN